MSIPLACIAGEEIHRQIRSGRLSAAAIGPRQTPFGPSADIYVLGAPEACCYLMPRHGHGLAKLPACRTDYRANLYALKDLGVGHLLLLASAGAIQHSTAIGDMVILSDLIDQTRLRTSTFYDDGPLGYLRQFPVFCPAGSDIIADVLAGLGLRNHRGGVVAVTEGPRMETPAEIRMLAGAGANLASHGFVPEVFLARELQICCTGVACVSNHAETGSRHRPLISGALFADQFDSAEHDSQRFAEILGLLGRIVEELSAALRDSPPACDCAEPLAARLREHGLGDDWRGWLKASSSIGRIEDASARE